MQRVLDLDLDFFVHGVEHWRDRDAGRLDADDYPATSVDEALDFLQGRCGLTGRLPGFVVEHHGELFARWRDAIDGGVLQLPFHVTHVDAHADLGLGDAGYVHLMSDLLFRDPQDRRHPREHLADGNYLLFAIGCRWLSGLDYVYNRDELPGEGPGDLMPYAMEGYRPDAEHIELPVFTRGQIDDLLFGGRPEPVRREPRVPFRAVPFRQYRASAPFDLICLARSPEYTPATCDPIYDAIREQLIVEFAPAPQSADSRVTP